LRSHVIQKYIISLTWIDQRPGFYTPAESIMISVRSLQRSEEDVSHF